MSLSYYTVYRTGRRLPMDGEIRDLSSLEKKYQEQVDYLQKQLEEARTNLTVVSQALALLRKEGNSEQASLFEAPPVLSSKYKDSSLPAAIKDILLEKHPEKLSADTIYISLVQNGFKSNSQNMKRDLYTRLFRMAQAGILTSAKKGKVKKYSLAKKEESIDPGMGIKEGGNQPSPQA
jgi:hypothetical protein